MYLVQFHEFKVATGESTAVVLSRALAALKNAGYEDDKLRYWFYFEEMINAKISACQRVVKKFPELAEFSHTVREKWSPDQEKRALHNLTADRLIPPPTNPRPTISPEVLVPIAEGIPKAYPFMYANFIMEIPDWLTRQKLRTDGVITDMRNGVGRVDMSDIPSIIVSSSRWTSRRHITLSTNTPIPMPAFDVMKKPAPPSEIQSTLTGLGKQHKKRTWIVSTNEEKQRQAELYDRMLRSLAPFTGTTEFARDLTSEVFERIPFPHDLPGAHEVFLARVNDRSHEVGNIGTKKATLIDVFRERGYRYYSKSSGQGHYELRKRTILDNQLEVSTSVGGWGSEDAMFTFDIQGMEWSHSFIVPASRKSVGDSSSYPILSQVQWRMLCENVAAVVDFIEREIVPVVEQVYGPTPKWYEYSD